MKPLAIDLFCGLGGWSEGLLAEGYDVIGFDNERHVYGEHRYPAQLVVQDVLTLHGSQFKDAALIVASPPCQEYSYMAMPWTRAKALAADYRSGKRDVKHLTALFDACFRIQREACAAAGRHIPMVVENVRGAIPWVGRSRWNFGSFHLWGDVPALMPMAFRATKHDGSGWRASGTLASNNRMVPSAIKNTGGSWFNVAHNTTSGEGRNPDGRKVPSLDRRLCDCQYPEPENDGVAYVSNECPIHNLYPDLPPDGLKTRAHPNKRDGHDHTRHLTNPGEHGRKVGGDWFGSYAEQKAAGTISPGRLHGKNSTKRKFASAMIAKIPLPLARHIAATYRPKTP